MAQTIADIIVTPTWQSLNTLASIAVGTSMIVDNKTIPVVILAEGTQPAPTSKDGVPLTQYQDVNSVKTILAGSLEIWVRTESDSAQARISVQER